MIHLSFPLDILIDFILENNFFFFFWLVKRLRVIYVVPKINIRFCIPNKIDSK